MKPPIRLLIILALLAGLHRAAGQVNFTLSYSPNVGCNSSVTAADINGDGKTDLISPNFCTNTLSVLVNTGDGFTTATVPVAWRSRFVVTSDVNCDGSLDLISANDNTMLVMTNNGSGGFALASTFFGSSGSALSVAAADVNGDSKPDFIRAHSNGTTISIFTNNGNGSFTFASSPYVGGETRFVSATDMNGDGNADLIVGGTRLTVLTNNGTGGFAIASSVEGEPTPALVADVNGDNKEDLISPSGENTMKVMTNNGSGGFVFATSISVGRYPLSAAAADVNGDGHMDLISGNSDSHSFSVLTNNGSCVFTLVCSPNVGFCPRVVAADINGDGKPDLISANSCGDTVSVLISVPTLTLNHSATEAILSWPSTWTNWNLQQNSNLMKPVWTIFNGTIGDNGLTKSVTNSSATGNNFFRLVYP